MYRKINFLYIPFYFIIIRNARRLLATLALIAFHRMMKGFIVRFLFPGRAGRYRPTPPQTRTSGFPAYGSSGYGFAA
jgi:hypothetical protein